MPRGAAPLAAVAGLCAVPVVAADSTRSWRALRVPAALLGLLLLWGALSALWAIEPARSLVKDLQLAGLFAAVLAVIAAGRAIADPRRLVLLTIAGTGLGLVLGWSDLGTSGGLSHYVTIRHFAEARLNQISVWAAILLLPIAVFLWCGGLWRRGRIVLGLASAAALGATVLLFEGTAAKAALLLSLPVAALLYLHRRLAAGIAAALTAGAVLTAPLTLPSLADHPFVLHHADTFKGSFGHRLHIWDFAGKRIAERPLLGWGLDSSRAIPGGKKQIRPGEDWMPLHPHDSALQVWLELGLPGTALFALLLGWFWLRLAAAPWSRLYAAAAGGSLAAVLAVMSAGWGIWEEWWLATLGLAAFAILATARAAAEAPAPGLPADKSPAGESPGGEPAIRLPRRGSRACDR